MAIIAVIFFSSDDRSIVEMADRTISYMLREIKIILTKLKHCVFRNEREVHKRADAKLAKATMLLVVVTFLLVIVGIVQGIVLKGQLDELRSEQRPWIGLGDVLHKENNATLILLVNGGKSPALNVRVKVSYHIDNGTAPEILSAPCVSDCNFHGIEMLPNVPIGSRVPRVEDAPVPFGTPIWYIIRADYEDSDGNPHKTGICLIGNSGGGMSDCPIPNSNYAD